MPHTAGENMSAALSCCCFLLFLLIADCQSLSCKDEQGKDVDWFIAYKIPKLEKQPAPFNSGYSYAYITPKTQTSGWTLSTKLVTDSGSLLGATLAQVYAPGDGDAPLSHVAYNDQKPSANKSASAGAHAKG